MYDSLKNPLHRYIVDYQGFNPLQTLIRYKPSISPATNPLHDPVYGSLSRLRYPKKRRMLPVLPVTFMTPLKQRSKPPPLASHQTTRQRFGVRQS
jgi:hypothetical protein